MQDNCFDTVGRRRLFWSTQSNACGTSQECGSTCGSAGLEYIDTDEGRTISTDEWVRSLALNILLTQGRREDRFCGFRPGERGGHWSDCYREDNGSAGSLILDIPTCVSIAEQTNLIQVMAQSALQKMIEYGVAQDVSVTAEYAGDGVVSLSAEIFGISGESSNVGVTASRLENSWVWNS